MHNDRNLFLSAMLTALCCATTFPRNAQCKTLPKGKSPEVHGCGAKLTGIDRRIYFPQTYTKSSLIYTRQRIAKGTKVTKESLEPVEIDPSELSIVKERHPHAITTYYGAMNKTATLDLPKGHLLEATDFKEYNENKDALQKLMNGQESIEVERQRFIREHENFIRP